MKVFDCVNLDLDYILDNLILEDVTDDIHKLEHAFFLVVKDYAKFAKRQVSTKQLLDDLCTDSHFLCGHTRVILAYIVIDHNIIPVGTVRVLLSNDAVQELDSCNLEFMNLFKSRKGWSLYKNDEFNYIQSAELERLALADFCRNEHLKKGNFHIKLIKLLISKGIDTAFLFGKNQIWAIMPQNVEKTLSRAGIKSSVFTGVTIDYKNNKELFERYNEYWQSCNPNLFRLYKSMSDN